MTSDRHRAELSPSYSWYVRDWRASRRMRKLSWKERGFYRELLDWSWDLNGLPSDLEEIRDHLEATRADFAKLWPICRQFFVLDEQGRWRNPRQEVERAKQSVNKRRASDGGKAKKANNSEETTKPSTASSTDVSTTVSSASHSAPPLPLPSPLPSPLPLQKKTKSDAAVDARSKHPVFKGRSFVVFDWMLEDFTRMLGKHTEAFELDVWLDALDQRTHTAGTVITPTMTWPWLQQQFLEEVTRRGLPLGAISPGAKTEPDVWAQIIAKGPTR